MKHTRDFRSWSDYLAYARTLPPDARGAGGRTREGAIEWASAPDLNGACNIAERGWSEGMDKVRSIALPAVDKMAATIEAQDERWGWDVTGAAYDVGEYLSGAPECWLAPTLISDKPCVTISINSALSMGIPKEMIEMRGAAVVALALALQTAGYAVRVYQIIMSEVDSSSGGWHSDLTAVRVCLTDDNGGPIDTDRLLFALAHPAATRLLGFSVARGIAGAPMTAGLGSPDDFPVEGWTSDFHMQRANYDDAEWRSKASVEAWVATQYAQLTKPRE